MKINDFWKYLGNFWDSYESKDTVEELWGSWAALISDQYLQLDQINKSKNIYTVPIYWKKLWLPFKTDDSEVEYDLLNNSVHEDAAVIVDLNLSSNIGFNYIVPGSIKIRTEFGQPVDLKYFTVDYWNGMITLVDDSVVSSGDQIILEFLIGEGHDVGAPLQHKDIAYDKENVFVETATGFKRGVRNKDYKIVFYSGELTELTGSRSIVQYEYFNLVHPFPYKYPTFDTLQDAAFIYTNTKKEGRFYTRDVDFIIENGFLRFKTKPSEPVLWAEEALFNVDNVYRMFGSSVGYLDHNSVDYYKAVLGLVYFLQHAPTPRNLEGIAHAILGLPVTFGNEQVLDVTITEDPFNSVTTTAAQYSLGQYTPKVYPGQSLLPIQPLTDVVKIHDRVNSKTFVDLLLYANILHSDQGYIANDTPQLYADSMFSRAGMHKIFAPWHTFLVEVNDPTLFQDKNKMALLRFVLQNKPAHTTYYMLFSHFFSEYFEPQQERLGIDWHDGEIESYQGQPFDASFIPSDTLGEKLVEALPHDSVDSPDTVETTYGLPVIPSTKKRFVGVDTIYDGGYLSPYSYSNIVVYDYYYDVIPASTYTFDNKTLEIKFSTLPPQDHVYISATRTNKAVSTESRPYTDKVQVVDGVGKCFRNTVLFDTMYVFGVNMTRGVVEWTVEAKSAYIDGNESNAFQFNEQIARAYTYGQDFLVDEQTGIFTIRENSRIIDGQRIYVDYWFIDFDQHVEYPATASVVTVDSSYQERREQLNVNTTLGYHSYEDVYWDGQIDQDHNDLIVQSVDPLNPWGIRRSKTPFLGNIIPKQGTEPIHLDYLNTPANAEDFEFFIRDNTNRFLELSPSTFLGVDGQSPYIFRYALPDEDYFVNRLTSVISDEDLSFGIGGFGISPFGGMPSLAFQIDYLEGKDFVVEHVVDGRNVKKEIRFKEEPVYTYFYMLRFKPEDFSYRTGKEITLDLGTYLNDQGEAPYVYQYSLPEELSYLDKLDLKTEDPGSIFSYTRGKDFEVETWPARLIKFKEHPIHADYLVYEHLYYKYPRMEDKLVSIQFAGEVDLGFSQTYRYKYDLPRKYQNIEILWNQGDHAYNYFIDKDFTIVYNSSSDKSEIRFKTRPVYGNYHPFHVTYLPTEIITNAGNHELVKHWGSLDYITHLRWLDSNQDSYVTERIEPEDVEIRAARSYVDRSDWHDGDYWCGPGVPIGGRIPGGNTLAPIATSMN